jgi:hypothetical protein
MVAILTALSGFVRDESDELSRTASRTSVGGYPTVAVQCSNGPDVVGFVGIGRRFRKNYLVFSNL